MNEAKQKVKIIEKLNLDGIRQAMRNAERPQNAIIEVPVVNPKDLRIDDEIFCVQLKPITTEPGTKKPKEPTTSVYPSTNHVRVDSLSKGIVENSITVNGSIDMPINSGVTTTLENVYVAKEDEARAIADALLEVQLENLEDLIDQLGKEKVFLLEQKKHGRL